MRTSDVTTRPPFGCFAKVAMVGMIEAESLMNMALASTPNDRAALPKA
jgi:hypothetical protein